MANISTAIVKVYVAHTDNAIWEEIDFDDTRHAGLRDAICALCYDDIGYYDEDGLFHVSGRWNYENNFSWDKERSDVWNEFVKVRDGVNDTLCFSWVDYDPGMDWMAYGDTHLVGDGLREDGKDYFTDNSETFTMAEASRILKVKKPRKNSEDWDAWDQFYANLSSAMVDTVIDFRQTAVALASRLAQLKEESR